MTYTQAGTCPKCGGPMWMPRNWMGIYPPEPQCNSFKCTQPNTIISKAYEQLKPVEIQIKYTVQPCGDNGTAGDGLEG